LHGYRYGTDGAGADTLLVRGKGMRPSCDAIRPRGRQRWPSALYMDGPSLIAFALEAIPKLIRETLEAAGCRREDIRHFILHQATLKMMEALRAAARIPDAAFPIVLEDVGNTVSSTIPIVIERMRKEGRLEAGQRNMLVGFGVGLSWAACVWDECWSECEKRFVGAPS
ncbi:MAG TPA: ketoacyl-ACP synthase III, partial [Bryobacterales bacterium]|nr:ketoacyl-ACP synthase III [Bryobacterales bacterium]